GLLPHFVSLRLRSFQQGKSTLSIISSLAHIQFKDFDFLSYLTNFGFNMENCRERELIAKFWSSGAGGGCGSVESGTMSNSGSLHIGGSSGDGSNPPKKRVRQESKGINVKKWIKKAQGPLKVDFDKETGKSYGRNGKAFNNMIGQQVRDGLSPRFACWNDVPKEDKALVLERLEENSETHDLPSLVDNFKEMHWRPSKGWTNETANTTYDEMIKMRASRLAQSANTDESVGSVPSPDTLTDDQIVDIVRGTRSRYKKGKGTLPRLKAIRGTAHNSSSNSALAREQAETIAALQRQIAKQSEEQEKSQKTIKSLIQALKEHIPNFNFQPSPHSS
ncbi:hypothetical protein PanWU01x14_022160, partial [Parasponia andersonii]